MPTQCPVCHGSGITADDQGMFSFSSPCTPTTVSAWSKSDMAMRLSSATDSVVLSLCTAADAIHGRWPSVLVALLYEP